MFACRHRSTTDRTRFGFSAIFGMLILSSAATALSSFAEGVPAGTEQRSAPCGVVEKSAGEAFVLDPSRVHVHEASEGRAVDCNGWVSSSLGWVEIRHRNGHRVRLSKNSFIQLREEEADLSVLRGIVHVQAFGDAQAFEGITPNGRARLKLGSALLIYNPEKESTQWVVLDQVGSLENRFQPESQVTVREGESSILDLTLPRLLPRDPRAITVASLKPVLKDLALPEKKFERAVKVALLRQRRVFPAAVGRSIENGVTGRMPASSSATSAASPGAAMDVVGDYHRHQVDESTPKLTQEFQKKVLRGTSRKPAGRRLKVIEAEQLEERLARKAAAEQARRREKLIEELGKISSSD